MCTDAHRRSGDRDGSHDRMYVAARLFVLAVTAHIRRRGRGLAFSTFHTGGYYFHFGFFLFFKFSWEPVKDECTAGRSTHACAGTAYMEAAHVCVPLCCTACSSGIMTVQVNTCVHADAHGMRARCAPEGILTPSMHA